MTAGVSAGISPEPVEDDNGGYVVVKYEYVNIAGEFVDQEDDVECHYTQEVRTTVRFASLLENGTFPCEGTYFDQPAKALQAVDTFRSATREAKRRKKEREEFLGGK